MIEKLNIAPELVVRNLRTREGSFCFVARSPELEIVLHETYGRDRLCLKVFTAALENWLREDPSKYCWEDVPLTEVTKAQNLFALDHLAPRVYAVVLLNNRWLAQVTDWAPRRDAIDLGKTSPHLVAQARSCMARYGIRKRKAGKVDLAPRNWIGKWFIDFGGLHFPAPEGYLRSLRHRSRLEKTGDVSERAYQDVPGLEIVGTRHANARVAALDWGGFDFSGKTVLDIGCSMGEMSRAASDRGARRVVGVDRYTAGVAYEISNWLGYWNVDHYKVKLPKGLNRIALFSGIETFDVVLCFSVVNHIGGWKRWIADLLKPDGVLFFEGHGRMPPETYAPLLEQDFKRVEFLGTVTDCHERALFLCTEPMR